MRMFMVVATLPILLLLMVSILKWTVIYEGRVRGGGLFKTMKPRDLDFFSQYKSQKLFKEKKKKIKYFVKYDSKSFITFFLKVQKCLEKLLSNSCPEPFRLTVFKIGLIFIMRTVDDFVSSCVVREAVLIVN